MKVLKDRFKKAKEKQTLAILEDRVNQLDEGLDDIRSLLQWKNFDVSFWLSGNPEKAFLLQFLGNNGKKTIKI